jgi:hypothetical protein
VSPSLVDLLGDWLKDSLFEPHWKIEHSHFIPKRVYNPHGYIYIGNDHIEYSTDSVIVFIPAADPDFFIRLEGILDTYDQ